MLQTSLIREKLAGASHPPVWSRGSAGGAVWTCARRRKDPLERESSRDEIISGGKEVNNEQLYRAYFIENGII